MMPNSLRMLVVAIPNSIHTARWLAQFEDIKKYDIHLFPSTSAEPHPLILNSGHISIHNGDLEGLIDKLKPDIIFTLEMQHAAYQVLPIRMKRNKFPIWLYFCWGIDIKWFEQFPEDKKKIIKILKYIDGLFVDDAESLQKALNNYHYKGPCIQVPVPGGYKVDEMRKLAKYILPSKRKIITVKGYTETVHQPKTVFTALKRCAETIKAGKYKIMIYLPGNVDKYVEELKKEGLKVEVFNWSPRYEDTLILLSKARINIAASLSDGLPNTMVEGMIMGAFPIQSKSKIQPYRGFIKNMVNGVFLNPLGINDYARSIKEALLNDEIVDSAAIINYSIIKDKMEYANVKKEVINFIDMIVKKDKKRFVKNSYEDLFKMEMQAFTANLYKQLMNIKRKIAAWRKKLILALHLHL